MAKYTVELSSMICAFAGDVDATTQYDSFDIIDTDDYKNPFHVDARTFDYLKNVSPNQIISNYALKFYQKHLDFNVLPHNFTDNEELNLKIIDKLLQNFTRHFWTYEIGQENPMSWFVVLQGFLDAQLPLYIQEYQKMIIDNENFITNLTTSNSTSNNTAHATSNASESSIAGNADTPQNELNFSLNTGDPTKDYNFSFASSVQGAKGISDSTSESTAAGTNKNNAQGRAYTIMQLVNQLETFANGLYINMWDKAKDEGLFLMLIS